MKKISIKMPNLLNKKNILILALIVVAIVISMNFFKDKYEISKITERVSKLIVLPKNEEPALFIIEDPEKILPNQPFFKGAQKGDVLLVYRGAARAILYGVDRNIIVNSGPVDFGPIPSNKP